MLSPGRYTTQLRVLIVVLAIVVCFTQVWRHQSGTFDAGPTAVGDKGLDSSSKQHEHLLSTVGSAETADEHRHCHFHAGIEHCTGSEPSHDAPSSSPSRCDKVNQSYDIPMRLLFVFVVLVGSAVGVFVPLLLSSPAKSSAGPSLVTIALKQCGTGVIISTAFVHLFTHANLMFANDCLVGYELFEGTTATIFMTGMLISFIVDFVAHRKAGCSSHAAHGAASEAGSRDTTPYNSAPVKGTEPSNVLILEAGIIFHSVLIGITLVVAGDIYFITLAIVITLHQMFEGLALGTRLAAMDNGDSQDEKATARHHETDTSISRHHNNNSLVQPLLPIHDSGNNTGFARSHQPSLPTASSPSPSFLQGILAVLPRGKYLLATCFTLVTPLGMLMGIALLGTFNGNDPGTIIAIGTLDALSAGILAWFGVVEMWAHDWLLDGAEMAAQDGMGVGVGLGSLVLGMVMMTVLGKWA
ncbi:Zinc-regulated transporter [Microdochium nivale]|nr:Zinc-regulated transporter [Microdochium nivale]